MRLLAALLALVIITGCHSIVTVNLGLNRETIAPAVICEEPSKHASTQIKISTLDPCKAPAPANPEATR